MSGRRRTLGSVVAGLCTGAVVLGGTVGADAGGRPFSVVLSGANEVNGAGVPNQGDPGGFGSVELTLNPGLGEVCWSIGPLTLTAGGGLPTRAHIHNAPAGSNGPIVVDFFNAPDPPPPSYPSDVICTTVARDLVKGILKNPSQYYVNLHSAAYPAGVMRGQLGE